MYSTSQALQEPRFGIDLQQCVVSGSSAGALVATLLAAGVNIHDVKEWLVDSPELHGMFNSSFGGAFKMRDMLIKILDTFLPKNVERVNGKLYILLCSEKSGLYFVNNFRSRKDLIEAVAASGHVPIFSDGTYSVKFRGEPHVDGDWKSTRDATTLCRSRTCPKLFFDHNDDKAMHATDKASFYQVTNFRTHLLRYSYGVSYVYAMSSRGELDDMPVFKADG